MSSQKGNPPKLTRKDEREIEKILDEVRKQLENAEGLMFDGEPASPEAIQSIIDSMRIGLEIAKQRNKQKYTPKKYRKSDKEVSENEQ
jgi:organic radical activating enzyme